MNDGFVAWRCGCIDFESVFLMLVKADLDLRIAGLKTEWVKWMPGIAAGQVALLVAQGCALSKVTMLNMYVLF